MNRAWLALSFLLAAPGALGASIDTNEVAFPDAPAWLKRSQLQRVVDRVQSFLEWDIRRIQVRYHTDQAAFQKLHGYDSSVLAFTKPGDSSVHLGPSVTAANFESTFGHELAHVILFQKYKGAIPKWLEEGLANAAAKGTRVDYAWLASQPARDLTSLSHPFREVTNDGARYHYLASSAAIEMLKSKCDLQQLIQLSVGKKLESYLGTFCGISDLNAEFRSWVKRKNPGGSIAPGRGSR